jgi:hypothetical protein
MRDAYIVTSVRTPGCRRGKGALKDTRPEDLLAFIMKAAVEKSGNIEPEDLDDVMIGCSFPEAEQGLNIGRSPPRSPVSRSPYPAPRSTASAPRDWKPSPWHHCGSWPAGPKLPWAAVSNP